MTDFVRSEGGELGVVAKGEKASWDEGVFGWMDIRKRGRPKEREKIKESLANCLKASCP